MHSDFTLFLRTYPNGKEVYFYYAYDDSGVRRGPWTTKSVTKTAARNYCHRLLKTGTLLPDRKKTDKAMTFGDFAKGFWERGSEYIANQEGRRDITESYIATSRNRVETQLLPFFAGAPLDKISYADVNNWLLGFKKRDVKKGGTTKKGYTNNYANTALSTLNIMMTEAVRRGLIQTNPCTNVQRLKSGKKKIEILTVEETQKLFGENWQTVWGGRDIAYAANRLASLTGMRGGEVQGLRGEYVFDGYILVCGSYGQFGYGPTKTKESRNIPLLPEMTALLRELTEQNGGGYVFSFDGGASPVSRSYIAAGLRDALANIGIDKAEMKRRGLSLHGWRYFLNTELQRQGLTVQQVQSVTGHTTSGMTEKYTRLDARQLDGVIQAQAVISGSGKPGGNDPGAETAAKEPPQGRGRFHGFAVVKKTEREEAPRKLA